MTEEQKNAIAEIRTRNPADTIEALSREDGISIAQQIVLVRMESPLLLGDVSDPVANAMAVYAMSLPVGEAARLAQNRTVLEAVALEWVDGVSRKDFAEMLDALLSAILLFWKLLPRPEGDGEKKDNVAKSGMRPPGRR